VWFLNKSEFQIWCDGGNADDGLNPVLACYGIPSAGKSVMRYGHRKSPGVESTYSYAEIAL
jgi:hypothetical protein